MPLFAEGGARMRGIQGLFTGPGFVEMPTATLSDEILEPGNGQIRALECRSEPLGRSDGRPSGGAHEREEVVPAYEKRVYIT